MRSSPSPADGAPSDAQEGSVIATLNSAVLKEINVLLTAKLGETTLTIEQLLALRSGQILSLGSKLNDLVELQLNQSVVARGELVAVGDHFGVRIVEIAHTQ